MTAPAGLCPKTLRRKRRITHSDAYHLNRPLDALFRGKISFGRFVEVLDEWLDGASSFDLGGSAVEQVEHHLSNHPGSTTAVIRAALPHLNEMQVYQALARLRKRGRVDFEGRGWARRYALTEFKRATLGGKK